MAQQQFLFAEAISGMKKALTRDDGASDSDDSIQRPTNRGNKLKRKARFVQEGRLDQADGPRVYKRRLNYNGYQREVISKNPLRLDADGDVFDDEDDESNPELTDAEEDPYRDIKLHELLMPLTSAADLDKHPSLSVPYKSRVVDEMLQAAQDMVFREQRRLYRMRQVLTQFRGDERWIPCGLLQQDSDSFAVPFPPHEITPSVAPSVVTDLTHPAPSWEPISSPDPPRSLGDGAEKQKAKGESQSDTASAESARHADKQNGDAQPDQTAGQDEKSEAAQQAQEKSSVDGSSTTATQTNGDEKLLNGSTVNGHGADEGTNGETHKAGANGAQDPDNGMNADQKKEDDGEEQQDDTQQTHRMTTRARAQATDNARSSHGSPPLSPQTDSGAPLVHPFFTVPLSCLPQPSLGLYGNLADDTRRLLASFVQKQEEVVRQAESLLNGLMKTRRLRNTVWSWCRAEGHVGEMSDGEDWYDMEEWGLDEPLKKGEEIDDDVDVTQTVAGSKTRGRNRRNDRM